MDLAPAQLPEAVAVEKVKLMVSTCTALLGICKPKAVNSLVDNQPYTK